MQSGSREKPCNIRGLSLANLDEQPAASGDQLASDRGDPAIGIEPILAAIEREPGLEKGNLARASGFFTIRFSHHHSMKSQLPMVNWQRV